MSGIQNTIIKIFSSQANYNIIEYKDAENSSWALFRENNDVNEFLLFFHKQINEDEYNRIYNYIKNTYENKNTIVYMLMMGDNEVLSSMNNKLVHPYSIDNINFQTILLDVETNNIISFDQEAQRIASLINNIVNFSDNHKKVEKKQNVVTNILIVINIAMFLLSIVVSKLLLDIDLLTVLEKSIFDIDGRILLLLGAKYNPLIDNGQYYRFITAMFLHGGIVHLAFNMYALKSLGPFIESIYGRIQFICIYFLGGICASIISYVFSDSMSVGASGAIFALLGAALLFGIKKKSQIGKSFLSSIVQVIVINLVMGFTLSNIDNFAHIGGLVGGIIISLIISTLNEKKIQRA